MDQVVFPLKGFDMAISTPQEKYYPLVPRDRVSEPNYQTHIEFYIGIISMILFDDDQGKNMSPYTFKPGHNYSFSVYNNGTEPVEYGVPLAFLNQRTNGRQSDL